jgi:hypothetical protein
MRASHRWLDTAASGGSGETSGLPAQNPIIDPVMAYALQADAIRTHLLMA